MSYQDDLDWLARNVHEWVANELLRMKPCDKGDGTFRASWCYSGDGGFTKDQWLARRAELQNKPSWCLSGSWSKYLAQDMDGEWKWLGENPSLVDDHWIADELRSQCKGVVIGDWRDTLEKRPDMSKNSDKIYTSVERVQKTPESVHVGHKADHGNPIMGAIPPHAELAVARVLTFGAEKYARNAWKAVENAEVRYMDAALRHLNAHRRGELADGESGESHLAHAACCILFMLDMQERKGGQSE